MLGWLYRILIGTFKPPPTCRHEWGIIEEHVKRKHTVEEEAVSMFEKHTTSKEFDQKTIILQCAKCGEVKTKKIEL